jgi:hypothetical protein
VAALPQTTPSRTATPTHPRPRHRRPGAILTTAVDPGNGTVPTNTAGLDPGNHVDIGGVSPDDRVDHDGVPGAVSCRMSQVAASPAALAAITATPTATPAPT